MQKSCFTIAVCWSEFRVKELRWFPKLLLKNIQAVHCTFDLLGGHILFAMCLTWEPVQRLRLS